MQDLAFKKLIDRFSYQESWLRRSTFCWLGVFVVLSSVGISQWIASIDGVSLPIWMQLGFPVGCFAAAGGAWLYWRRKYLRGGEGIRLAIAFDAFEIDREAVTRTRQNFIDQFNDNSISQIVSIRLVEKGDLGSSSKKEEFCDKYKFDAIFMVRISRDIEDNRPYFKLDFHQRIFLKHPPNSDILTTIATTSAHIKDAVKMQKIGLKNESDYYDVPCRSLFDAILIALAGTSFCKKEFDRAAEFANLAESRLSRRQGEDESPRSGLRDLAILAMTAETFWSFDDPFDLVRAEKMADAAVRAYRRYPKSPQTAHAAIRATFLAKQQDVSKRILDRTSGSVLELENDSILLLDAFVISVTNSNWADAAKCLKKK